MNVISNNMQGTAPKVFDSFAVTGKVYQPLPLLQPVISKAPTKDTFTSSKPKKKIDPITYQWGALALAIGAALAFGKLRRTPEQKEIKELLKVYKKQMAEFPQDIAYRKKLLEKLNIPGIKVEHLRPVIGPQEYKKMLTEFNDSAIHYSPGEELITATRDAYSATRYEQGLYRANLHTHSINSDGKMSISDILHHAAGIGNITSRKMPAGAKMAQNPFTVAITDHDTLEGCKKALRLITTDPLKYKNARVVLGTELSVENKTIPQQLNRPISHHMLAHVIDPFDEKLNSFLDAKKLARIDFAKEFISKAQALKDSMGLASSAKLSYEDAKDLYPALRHGATHIYYSSKDYAQFRTIFAECFENNPAIQKLLKERKPDPMAKYGELPISYTRPLLGYFKELKGDYQPYWKKYQEALSMYTADLFKIPESEAKKLIVVTSKMKEYFNKVDGMIGDFLPKMDLQPAYMDINDVIKVMKEQEYGFVGLAHPAIIKPEHFLKNPSEKNEATKAIITKLKEIAGDKAAFIEHYYHYFGKDIQSKEGQELLKTIQDTAKAENLLLSGGIDCHGQGLMYSLG